MYQNIVEVLLIFTIFFIIKECESNVHIYKPTTISKLPIYVTPLFANFPVFFTDVYFTSVKQLIKA